MVSGLSKEQSLCIRHFLEYIDQANPGYFENYSLYGGKETKIAIERYWKNFKD